MTTVRSVVVHLAAGVGAVMVIGVVVGTVVAMVRTPELRRRCDGEKGVLVTANGMSPSAVCIKRSAIVEVP